MDVAEYARCDATELRRLIAAGEVSAAEVGDAARAAIAQVEPQINAISHGPYDDVEQPEAGPFAGVPIAVKDTLFEAGRPMTLGSRFLDGVVAPVDATITTRLRTAGFVTLARTATPEFAFNVDTAPVTNGPTRNPWSLEHSPGGSSGGSGALVAAGAVPVAHGSDGGGSLRLPAGWCGLVGLKPTRGRVPPGPHISELVSGNGQDFVLTRTVRDAAAVLDVLGGPALGDRYYVERPHRPYINEVGADPGVLRIALHTTSLWGDETAPDVRVAVERVARELERAGHHVEESVGAVDTEALHNAHLTLWSLTLAGIIDRFGPMLHREPTPETVEVASLACIEHGATLTGLDVAHAFGAVNTISRAWGTFLNDYDLFLCPTAPTTAPRSGEPPQNDARYTTADAWITDVFDRIPFTPIANSTGQPSVSLPLGMSDIGLPIGVMLTAQSLREDLLFGVAAQLEEALPWRNLRPSVTAH